MKTTASEFINSMAVQALCVEPKLKGKKLTTAALNRLEMSFSKFDPVAKRFYVLAVRWAKTKEWRFYKGVVGSLDTVKQASKWYPNLRGGEFLVLRCSVDSVVARVEGCLDDR